MVFSKASVWYENVVKPLRRLTSATTNGLFVSQRYSPRAHSPAKSRPSEELKAESSPIQECVFTGHSKHNSSHQEQQSWRDLLQNPLDVMLSDSCAPEHPVNMISRRFNKPFSTSVVDQARRSQPEKQTPRPYIERPSRRSPGTTMHEPRPTTRQKEFGSKKYRKLVHDKIIRKGPNFNIRRRNRLCMQSCAVDLKSSIDFSDYGKDKLLCYPLRNDEFATAIKPAAKKDAITLSVTKETNYAKEEFESCNDDGALEIDEKVSGALKSKTKGTHGSLCCAPVRAQRRDAANSLIASTSKTADTPCTTIAQKKGSPRSEYEKTKSKTTSHIEQRSSGAQRMFPSENGKKSAFATMRDSLQEAAQDFKCSLWKRAVTGGRPLPAPLSQGDFASCCAPAPCCTSAKLHWGGDDFERKHPGFLAIFAKIISPV